MMTIVGRQSLLTPYHFFCQKLQIICLIYKIEHEYMYLEIDI